ncbi:MAG TPA: sodium-dependent transporter, partial [Gemmatimonadaceae bacterium]|nr:sodium-dependent transporter [Gemmatimonadaceae bacterium]
ARRMGTVARETFSSRFGIAMTMIGVALGLGNVWRFPYLVGRYGGAAFVLAYVLIVLLIAVPALMGEWALGRHAKRGTVGAFAAAGVPGGAALGWFLFVVVVAATAYYTNVVGWVLYFAVGEVATAAGLPWQSTAVLPPESGFDVGSLIRQAICTGVVVLTCAVVLQLGLRAGIERVSRIIIPTLLVVLLVLIARSLTLDGAGAGVRWYIGHFAWSDLTPTVIVAALGHAIFSLSLGGTFMVTYGSYLADGEDLGTNAALTAGGDTISGLLAGLVIFPAVFAFGLEPASGPALLFDTIPGVFERMPLGWIFSMLFFAGLFGAGYLSDVAAFEVLIAGLTDNTRLSRARAVWLMAGLVYVIALLPMVSMRIFTRWDLTFGSGMQTFGALCAALAAGWAMRRGALLAQLGGEATRGWRRLVPFWLRYVVPGAILAVGVWWLLTDVLRMIGSV